MEKKIIEAWAVYMPEIGIEWSSGDECLAIYKTKEQALKRKGDIEEYEIIPVTITY